MSMNKTNRIVVNLRPGLHLAPTPEDTCEYVGSKVFCYFDDFGKATKKTLIGYIGNDDDDDDDDDESNTGSLIIVTSGDGSTLLATKDV